MQNWPKCDKKCDKKRPKYNIIIIGKSVYIYYLDDMILFAKFYSDSLVIIQL